MGLWSGRRGLVGLLVACTTCQPVSGDLERFDPDSLDGVGVELGLPGGTSATERRMTALDPRSFAAWKADANDRAATLDLVRELFAEQLQAEAAPRATPREHLLTIGLPEASREHLRISTRGLDFAVRDLGRPMRCEVGGDIAWCDSGRLLRVSGTAGAKERGRALRIQDYDVLDRADGVWEQRLAVRLPEGIESVRDAGAYLELRDGEGTPVLRFHYGLARDAHGRGRRARTTLGGVAAAPDGSDPWPVYSLQSPIVTLATVIELEGLAPPVVVDPGWSSTAGLGTQRFKHTATLLPRGEILVAGGYTPGAVPGEFSATTELYNPQRDAWRAGPAMAHKRESHTATLLATGDVLVVGGYDFDVGGVTGTCEVYNPAFGSVGQWRVADPIPGPRRHHTATLLQDGTVLVVGGGAVDTVEVALASAYRFDRTRILGQQWRPIAAMGTRNATLTAARGSHTATLLSDGSVLFVGGKKDPNDVLSTLERYDPNPTTQGFFGSASSLNVARAMHTATLMADGRVAIVGGWGGASGAGALDSWELYDSNTDVVGLHTGTAGLATARQEHTATLLPSGTLLVIGGSDKGVGVVTSELLRADRVGFIPAGTSALARWNHTSTLLGNGRVLSVGGTTGTGTPRDLAETYAPGDGWFTPTTVESTPSFLTHYRATSLLDGSTLYTGRNVQRRMGDGQWEEANVDQFTPGREGHTATLLPGGTVVVIGGTEFNVSPTVYLSDIWFYDPGTGVGDDAWTRGAFTASLGRSRHTATFIPSAGKVLVAGGFDGVSLDSAVLIPTNPVGSVVAASTMNTARRNHTATLLPTGEVLVVGGFSTATLATAEIYDPIANSWTLESSAMADARHYHTATLLPTGEVLIIGGNDGSAYLQGTAVFRPGGIGLVDLATEAECTSGTPPPACMPTGRRNHTATLLPSGLVLVAGGEENAGKQSGATELFDPGSRTWIEVVPSLAERELDPRFLHTAALLMSGQVVVAGGEQSSTTAQVYSPHLADTAWRPIITNVAGTLAGNGHVHVEGSGFRGVGLTTASGGGTATESSSGIPLVILMGWAGHPLVTLGGARYAFEPGGDWVDASLPGTLPPGSYRLWVSANGILSSGRVIDVGSPCTSTLWYHDADGDGLTSSTNTFVSCTDPDGSGNAWLPSPSITPDCNDAARTCTTDCATDIDADGLADCLDLCVDVDGDGYGSSGYSGDCVQQACSTIPCIDADCNDDASTCTTNCGTNQDNDAYDDCLDGCVDLDGDAYGIRGYAGTCVGDACNPQVCDGADCNDSASTCTVACDVDIDGDGRLDCLDGCVDVDEDDWGGAGYVGTCVGAECRPSPCSAGTTDCNDYASSCTDDCVTNVDSDTLADCLDACIDADGDGWGPMGYGSCSGAACDLEMCAQGDADCDDTQPTCTDDCDTDVDEDFVPDCADGCIDADGDGYGTPGGAGSQCLGTDCDDDSSQCGAGCFPGNTGQDLCDGYDHDCDGVADNDYEIVTACGEGHCRDNSVASSCVSGREIQCLRASPLSGDDSTCDGVDDDCDGLTDEDAGAGAACDDGSVCTISTCDPIRGACVGSAITGCCTTDDECTAPSSCFETHCDTTAGECVYTPRSTCCASAADCDDGNRCTVDHCNTNSGECVIDPIAHCCQTDADCDDRDPCTAGQCGVASRCERRPTGCSSTDPCGGDTTCVFSDFHVWRGGASPATGVEVTTRATPVLQIAMEAEAVGVTVQGLRLSIHEPRAAGSPPPRASAHLYADGDGDGRVDPSSAPLGTVSDIDWAAGEIVFSGIGHAVGIAESSHLIVAVAAETTVAAAGSTGVSWVILAGLLVVGLAILLPAGIRSARPRPAWVVVGLIALVVTVAGGACGYSPVRISSSFSASLTMGAVTDLHVETSPGQEVWVRGDSIEGARFTLAEPR